MTRSDFGWLESVARLDRASESCSFGCDVAGVGAGWSCSSRSLLAEAVLVHLQDNERGSRGISSCLVF